ncbi:hypothetical protein Ahy_B05g079386 isoform B [Arachis hypogaea]|uniref:Uncharacterized protein n=1 Tax=Arachis hypogaea TaxID=3818 RepID=A0A444Z9Q8_ARAHY|nr:hypothetical protein Ahy_B05g079386 isoform B [Arachis hypogaea]
MPSVPHHSPTLASSRIQNPNQKPSLFNGFDAAARRCRRLRGLLLPPVPNQIPSSARRRCVVF